jgi:hypothetical protein
MTRTIPTSAGPEPAPADAAGESYDCHRQHLLVRTEPLGTPTFGVRLRWVILAVPRIHGRWAAAQVMGKVVGEAWGGHFLHLLGHGAR